MRVFLQEINAIIKSTTAPPDFVIFALQKKLWENLYDQFEWYILLLLVRGLGGMS